MEQNETKSANLVREALTGDIETLQGQFHAHSATLADLALELEGQYNTQEQFDEVLLRHNKGIKFLLEQVSRLIGVMHLPEYRRLAGVFEVRIPERNQGGGGKRKKRGKKRRKTRKINN